MAVDLRTRYLGLDLGSPLVASSSPLTGELTSLRALAEAGAAAVVLPSLFEEELVREDDGHAADVLWEPGEVAGSAARYLAHVDRDRLDGYLDLVRDARRELEIPVIASLNGSTPGGWTKSAELLQQAGATAIELNLYGAETDRHASAAGVEERLIRLVHAVRHVVSIPVAVKLSPFFTSFAHLATRLGEVPIDGLVLFNRFHQTRVDLERLELRSEPSLSTRDELALPVRWISLLAGTVPFSLAATSGIHTSDDAVEAVLAGADVAMMASALLENGPGRLCEVRLGLERWLDEHGFVSVAAARGRLRRGPAGDPRAAERARDVVAIQVT